MTSQVQLDAGVVTRCRRRVHLEHDPAMRDAPTLPPDPTGRQRKADATDHRRAVATALGRVVGSELVEIPQDVPSADRERVTAAAMRAGVRFIWGAALPRDPLGGRRGGIDLLVKDTTGYVPVLVVRHKVSDPGQGARTSPLSHPLPGGARVDPLRKVRPQPRDQLRLAHAQRQLQAAGHAARGRATGGVVGMDADVVVWHDLEAPNWPGGRTALAEYDSRFADRLAVAAAAATGAQPLARPSRIVECRSCPWWPVCEGDLRTARDVSLVVRGEDAVALRGAGVATVDDLALLDPAEPVTPLVGMLHADAVVLARAWLRDLTVVRRVPSMDVPRADVEVDVDMESFGDLGAYMWGCLLSGADVGEEHGYRAFATWDPLPCDDEARSFAEFWGWLTGVRLRARARGLTFRAYCYNELAENRWLLGSAQRFRGRPGIPTVAQVREFISSDAWVDLFGIVQQQFLCAHGKGLKTIAPVAGFTWRDPEAGGENSMRWYRDAVGMDGRPPDPDQARRLLEYNEDDVRATHTLRDWMTSDAMDDLPFAGDL
ncbi:TM0106 family RecB-like putative nuclease [Saccharothrix longispora]|uniref:TM0106 family RecB-like putative nuclease n=1 Tax=Saccharothrix longispora TaxID=33920 RepID=UPI0028FD94CF|nr:TM0106 family RecB-like putative nuclease [Saccharothrix longispora]MBY8848305.1 TM0106 family RecB-like putative nuclease [Saccharothrix sp. MB29]MDU0289611.1 TM0106 family RecB-like putative nuclease [Saccharothrix longispora]